MNPKDLPYSKKGLWTLFLMCAFPLHFWTLLMAFRDVSWVTERTNLWDAIGVLSYGMVFAFVESIFVFVIAVLGGFLISKYWEQQRVALLSVLVFITAIWSIIGQPGVLSGLSIPYGFAVFVGQQSHPVRVLYGMGFIFVALSVILPAYLIIRSKKALQIVEELTDRLSLLSSFYLVFDVIGLIIVIIRNI